MSAVSLRVVFDEDLEVGFGGGGVGEALLGLLVVVHLVVLLDDVLGEFGGPELSPGLLHA